MNAEDYQHELGPEPGTTPDHTHGLPGPAAPMPSDDVDGKADIEDLDHEDYTDDDDEPDAFEGEDSLPEGYDHHDDLLDPDAEG